MLLHVQLLLFVMHFQVEAHNAFSSAEYLYSTPQKLTKKPRYFFVKIRDMAPRTHGHR